MPPASEPSLYASRPYSPPQYLLSSTGLSRDTFISQFEGFRHSLQYVETAPELVFERLVGNLAEAFSQALIQERTEHAAAEEAWRIQKGTLQPDLGCATAVEQDAEKCIPQPSLDVQAHRAVHSHSPTVLPAPTPPVETSIKQTYLQFWFSSYSDPTTRNAGFIRSTGVRAAETSVPVPFGIATSWPEMEIVQLSTNRGCYDSRLDPLVSTPIIPATLTHVVHFYKMYSMPPQVAVWLTGLSAPYGAAVCVQVTATNVTQTEFVLQISSGDGMPLGSVGAAWVVWPQPYRTLRVGSVRAVSGDSRVKTLSEIGELPGGNGNDDVLLLAISKVDLVLGGVWIDISVRQARSLKWEMKAGPGRAVVYSPWLAFVCTQPWTY